MLRAGGLPNGRLLDTRRPKALDGRGKITRTGVGTTSVFSVEYFFAGSSGPIFKQTFNGPKDADYLISNKLTAQSVVWSACGADVNLRTNSSIRVSTKQNKQALATVDSEDIKAAIIYKLQWKKC